jgi:hypothetical protein
VIGVGGGGDDEVPDGDRQIWLFTATLSRAVQLRQKKRQQNNSIIPFS